ncbi:DMT family transporter [Shimia sp. CNT1-13L.2]|uniref:DMT family transporter n=1 Tax=Shimia sp. CNT1-13L.2 TaxID=2959663 RepID=UPI0020CEDAC0|nr:DMT family transporter [Shimia sp. CNT1-13L.2]MCP9484075.1 DMT family transporter [Shimia sp. CNT1-13L.2]
MKDKPQDHFGILLRVLSGVFFAAMIVAVKLVSTDVPLGEIVFFRSAFALIPLVAFLWVRQEFPSGLRPRRPWLHVVRSALGAMATFTSFATIARLSAAEATLISYLAPILLAMIAVVLLGEKLTVFRVTGLLLGLAGVVVLIWPALSSTSLEDQGREGQKLIGIALGLATAILTAFSLIVTRILTRTDNLGGIAFWFAVATAGAGLGTLPLGWVIPDPKTMALLAAAGAFGGCAHIAMTMAFKFAEASRLAPFEYIALVWLVLADLIIFELPLSPAFFVALPLVLAGAMAAALERAKRT